MNRKNNLGLGMALGVAARSILVMVFDQKGLWIPICLALGAGIGRRIDRRKNDEKDIQVSSFKEGNAPHL